MKVCEWKSFNCLIPRKELNNVFYFACLVTFGTIF